MKIKKLSSNNHNKNYINSKINIFDAISSQVSAQSNGSNAVLVNLCHTTKNDLNFYSKEIHGKYPIALTTREMTGKTSLGKFQPVLAYHDKKYGHKTYLANIYACATGKQAKKRSINYYAFGRGLHQLSMYIKSNINSQESPNTKIFIDKKSFMFTGCDWSFLDSLIDDIMPDTQVQIYD